MARRTVKVVLPVPIYRILEDEMALTGLSGSELLRNAYLDHLKRHNLYKDLVHTGAQALGNP